MAERPRQAAAKKKYFSLVDMLIKKPVGAHKLAKKPVIKSMKDKQREIARVKRLREGT